MITLENLKERVQFFKENGKELNLGNESKPLFVNGEFHDRNWNGGDAIIRQFCNMLEDKHYGELVTYGNDNEKLVCKIYRHEEQTYVSFVHIETCLYGDGAEDGCGFFEGMETFVNKYELNWYKNRGRVDLVRFNDMPMKENNYIELLNKIEELTDFKFKLK